MRIQLLDSTIFNRIAAGEVVERPSSIVKELVENSIDAGASVISIEIEDGGKKKITVSDNGHGIEKEDLEKAFLPHATSKIKSLADLDRINTLGFRGEALASIASVCHIYASSKTEEALSGSSIRIDGGLFREVKDVARNKGTTIEATDLFYNAPVRAKFLRKSKREEAEITQLVEKFMLAHPEISFLYVADGKQIYNTISAELSDIIYTIYGKEVYDNLIKVDAESQGVSLTGFIVSPRYSRSNRTYQTLFVNGRFIENYLISSAIQGAYEPFLMKGRFPIFVLGLKVDPEIVDVNIHPTKKEVRFQNPNAIFAFVLSAIKDALHNQDMIASFDNKKIDEYKYTQTELQSSENKQGFRHIPIVDFEPMSKKEGKSFKDAPHDDKKVDSQKKGIDEVCINTEKLKTKSPDFLNITIDEDVPINKRGGPIFFDQSAISGRHFFPKQENFINASVKDEMKIFGTLFKTYILVEYDEKLYFIDQHAAHERILFDKLLRQVETQNVLKQPLLINFDLKLSSKEKAKFEDVKEELQRLGFEVVEREGKVQISSVPLILSNISLNAFVDDIMADEVIWNKSVGDLLKERLAQYACKHAVKAGDSLSNDAIASLLEDVRKGVLLCPHGRPIVVEMTKRDLEKLFKRIV